MASGGSFVGFSQRSSRGSGGYGVRGRRTLSNRRTAAVSRRAGSVSLPAWAADQHQELLAARDMEALSKLANGGTEDFITYANGRIAALGGVGATADHWKGLLAEAGQKAATKTTNNLVKQYQSQLQAGEIAGSKYIDFLNGEIGKYKPGSDEHTALVAHLADAHQWIDMQGRALEKRHDEEMAASVASHETPLEDALSYYQSRRDKLQPGDPAYATLTSHIASIKDGINARDFNAAVQTAHGKLVDAGNTTEAKQAYMGDLTKLMNTVRDPKLQQSLYDQIGKLQEGIKKDGILKDAQETNSKMVDYFDPNGKTNATTMLQYLAEKALSAKDPAEANKYSTLASQVQAHERQKTQDAIAAAGRADAAARRASGGSGGSAAGPGFSAAATERAIFKTGVESSYKDALQTVNEKLKDGITPTESDWGILKAARDNYLNIAASASEQGNIDTKRAMDTLVRKVHEESGRGDGWDFGSAGRKQAEVIVADIKKSSDEVSRIGPKGDTELYMQEIAKQNAEIEAAKRNPFIITNKKQVDALTEISQRNAEDVSKIVSDAAATVLGTKSGLHVQKMADMFQKYQDGGGHLKFAEWGAQMTRATTAEQATELLNVKGDYVHVSASELASFQRAKEGADTELTDAKSRLAIATAARRPDGTMYPGAEIDAATVAAEKLAQIKNGETPQSALAADSSGQTYGHGDFGPGINAGNLAAGGPKVTPSPMAAATDVQPTSAAEDPNSPEYAAALNAQGGATDVQGVQGPVQSPDAQDRNLSMDASLQAPTADQTIASGPEPDPWGAAGLLDESTRAAARSGFSTIDPMQSAWTYLNAPVDWQWPGAELPELPPESAWTGYNDFQSPDAQDRNLPEFDTSLPDMPSYDAGPSFQTPDAQDRNATADASTSGDSSAGAPVDGPTIEA